jgi:hypothetical protein
VRLPVARRSWTVPATPAATSAAARRWLRDELLGPGRTRGSQQLRAQRQRCCCRRGGSQGARSVGAHRAAARGSLGVLHFASTGHSAGRGAARGNARHERFPALRRRTRAGTDVRNASATSALLRRSVSTAVAGSGPGWAMAGERAAERRGSACMLHGPRRGAMSWRRSPSRASLHHSMPSRWGGSSRRRVSGTADPASSSTAGSTDRAAGKTVGSSPGAPDSPPGTRSTTGWARARRWASSSSSAGGGCSSRASGWASSTPPTGEGAWTALQRCSGTGRSLPPTFPPAFRWATDFLRRTRALRASTRSVTCRRREADARRGHGGSGGPPRRASTAW